MKYRSQVPLLSARDVERPEPRIRLYRLSDEARAVCAQLGLQDGDTLADVRAAAERTFYRLNADQRRVLLERIAELTL